MITLYLEDIKGGPAFSPTAPRRGCNKPVLVIKTGRTQGGQAATASHTGALAGDACRFPGGLPQAGAIEMREDRRRCSTAPWPLLTSPCRKATGWPCSPMPVARRPWQRMHWNRPGCSWRTPASQPRRRCAASSCAGGAGRRPGGYAGRRQPSGLPPGPRAGPGRSQQRRRPGHPGPDRPGQPIRGGGSAGGSQPGLCKTAPGLPNGRCQPG